MDIWNILYDKARSVQNSRVISPFIEAGGVAAAILTGLGIFDDLAKRAGAGTLVPITGFANAIAAPAVEFKTEGFILGVGAKMFTIAGPVIVYGVSASVVYGFIYWICQMFK